MLPAIPKTFGAFPWRSLEGCAGGEAGEFGAAAGKKLGDGEDLEAGDAAALEVLGLVESGGGGLFLHGLGGVFEGHEERDSGRLCVR